jgi:phosphoserine aminotransferase
MTADLKEKIGDMPIVCDMSSNMLTMDVDVTQYDVIYAGAQKNCGPSGVTIVIVKKSLLGNAKPICPTVMNWKTMADNESMPNTPPCYAIYMCGLNFDYIKRNGGIAAFKELAGQRSQMIYNAIDNSDGFYVNKINPAYRSRTNIPFVIQGGNPDLEKKFVAEATE